MSLPYENATSGSAALNDIQKILRGFGCNKFGSWQDDDKGELAIQFEHRSRTVMLRASIKGYAVAWLKEHPWSGYVKRTKLQHERRALDIASVAVYSILRDYVKAQVTAIEVGLLTFEGAWLGQIMLPTGKTVLEEVEARPEWRQAITGPTS